ncbi:MAG: response regulator [Ginsengibacter sp.]
MKEINILLVEDNEGDILLTLEALNEAKIHNEINVVKDGDAALRYMKKEGEYADVETPDLILLDINLPKMDGIEVLTELKNDDVLCVIPVVMLTTSDSEKDIFQAYQSHANCYITKPVNFGNFMEVIQTIKDFWINIVKLPKVNDE